MKAYLLAVLVVDHDGIGPEAIAEVLNEARYPNRCILPEVLVAHVADIGEWSDDHLLNTSSDYAEIVRAYPWGEHGI